MHGWVYWSTVVCEWIELENEAMATLFTTLGFDVEKLQW